MRRACLLLVSLVLTSCGFEEPPSAAPEPVVTGPAVAPAQVDDLCTDIVLTLLDGQLVPLPTADPATFDRAGRVADQFQTRYDEVIASDGVEAARARYSAEIGTACKG